MCELIIRQAGTEDTDLLTEMDKLCFDAPWSRESFRQEMEENQAAFYIIGELDGIPVGYAGLWAIVDEGHITNVAVHPNYRKRKIASAIMEALIDVTQQAGIKSYTLEVRRSNEGAIGLYEKFGFTVEGVRPRYYEDNKEDALIMWRY